MTETITAPAVLPCGCPPGAHDNGEPGGFYVSVKDGKRTGKLLGPLATHEEAQRRVPEIRALAERINSRAVFYAFGTCRVVDGDRPPGLLNKEAARASVIPAGTEVQYRKVGRGTVSVHVCPVRCTAVDVLHRYVVAFTTGRHKGTSREVWLTAADKIGENR
jgi:hypothetical protein